MELIESTTDRLRVITSATEIEEADEYENGRWMVEVMNWWRIRNPESGDPKNHKLGLEFKYINSKAHVREYISFDGSDPFTKYGPTKWFPVVEVMDYKYFSDIIAPHWEK